MTCLLIGLASGTLDWTFSWEAHRCLLAVAIGSQVIGWTLITTMLPRLRALEASVLLLSQPVATVLWGRLLFAEILSGVQLLGIGLVISGVGWLSIRGSVVPAREVPGE